MTLLAPRLGRGRLPVCLTSFQEHMPTVLSLESCSRNRVLQVTYTLTNTRSHVTHTGKHITFTPHCRTFVFAKCSWNNTVMIFRVCIWGISLIFSTLSIFLLILLFIHILPHEKFWKKKSRDCNNMKKDSDLKVYSLIGQVLWIIML